MTINNRKLFLAIFLVCLGLLGFGLVLQHVKHLEPCPLCILQRIAFIAIGITALAAAIHNPKRRGWTVYGSLLAFFSVLGGGVAAWQVYLQHLPPGQVPECGPGLDYMLEAMPLTKILPLIFKGSGECAEVTWTFLELSIAQWALGWFVLFALVGVIAAVRRR
ncbi:MAG: disulfide bond formation protein B [Sulfuricella sp.]|nr:disulfide bond formation protein B [Gammaproteobacteria bacterium]